MSKIHILFTHNERPDIKNMLFEFDKTLTIKEMLLDFLKKTNSKMILDVKKTYFMHKSKILNQENYLNKILKEEFKKDNDLVQITDCDNIVG